MPAASRWSSPLPNGDVETRSYDANRLWLPGQGMGIVITAPNARTIGATLFFENYTRNDLAAFSGPDHPVHIALAPSNRPYGNWTYAYDTVDRLTQTPNRNSADDCRKCTSEPQS